MKRYTSIYELEAEVKAKGFKTVPELDLTIEANDNEDSGDYLSCDDGYLYSYPEHKFYVILTN